MYPHAPWQSRIVKTNAIKPNAKRVTVKKLPRGSYRNWDPDSMEMAISAVEHGESLRSASEQYSVPRATLHDHITGRVQFGARSGPKPYLTTEEEGELASFVLRCAKIGYPYTMKQILGLVQQVIDKKGIADAKVSTGWWERFSRRHPELTLRCAAPLSYARAMATDHSVIEKYYDMLEHALRSNGIFDKPGNIFNCDESGMPLCPKPPKIIDKVGAKNPNYLTGNTKSQITVLACVSAAGYAIPPFVIFDRKTLNPEYTRGEVPGTLYGLSQNGWIDMGLFSDWFFTHFLSYAPPIRPLLLLMDGHSSHFCPEVIKAAAAEKVILCALPPHTTHLLQPLDKGCFGPLKSFWKQICHNFISHNPGRQVTRFEFSMLFSEAWYQAMTMSNIVSSFKTTGICPFNRRASSLPDEESYCDSTKMESLAQRSGLAYIPLFSPAPPRSSAVCSKETTLNKELSFSEPDLSSPVIKPPQQFFLPLRSATSISHCLKEPLKPSKIPTKRPKSSGRILTGAENLQQIEEKEFAKLEATKLKEEKKRLREEKKRLKELGREKKKAKKSASNGES